jgi:hypothetical protein
VGRGLSRDQDVATVNGDGNHDAARRPDQGAAHCQLERLSHPSVPALPSDQGKATVNV